MTLGQEQGGETIEDMPETPAELTGPLPSATTNGSVQAAMAAATGQGSQYAPAASCATCPERSLRLKLGWTFYPDQVPKGSYQLVPGMTAPQPIPADGQIVLDRASNRQVPAQVMQAELVITLESGPTYSFDVSFELPAIHQPTGLQRRLTNLGLYAGITEFFDGRALWAMRAFKRIHMNRFTRNASARENDQLLDGQAYRIPAEVMEAVRKAHGAHPADRVSELEVPEALLRRGASSAPDAGMFGAAVLQRGSYDISGGTDDSDPRPDRPEAIWAGRKNPGIKVTRPGYQLCLGAYNEGSGEAPIENRVNLPQPVHMLQFALFETGFWLIAGKRARGRTITAFGPSAAVGATNAAGGRFGTLDGAFGRSTQWALREFQCHAKLPQAAVEDLHSTGELHLQRIIRRPPEVLSGHALYPEAGLASGGLNAATARALQSWLERAYRCPVHVYASPAARSLDPAAVVQEGIWRYDDYDSNAPRMFAVDLSATYPLPASINTTVQMDGQTIPKPITIGGYTGYNQGGVTYGGQLTGGSHIWNLETTEVTPQTIYGSGGYTGTGLSAAQLSTFKVVRAASHFECLGHFDSLNAYDRVTLSFGLCHWTLAVLGHSGSGTIPVEEAREMGALFAYIASVEPQVFRETIGRFGMSAASAWPLAAGGGAYFSAIHMESESGPVLLCGANYRADPTRKEGIEDNHYGHLWPLYYRMQMANRTSNRFQIACGKFARQRIANILAARVGTGRVSDYLTSEKAVAMAYRAHIYTTSTLNRLTTALGAIGRANPTHNQAREELAMTAIERAASGPAVGHVQSIRGWSDLPQRNGIALGVTYRLNLDDPSISGTVGSFRFDPP